MKAIKNIIDGYNRFSLIARISIGIGVGIILALIVPQAEWISFFGEMFVGALKAVAPVLVAVLVTSSLCRSNAKPDGRFAKVIFLYLLTTLIAAFLAVIASFIFPQTIMLAEEAGGNVVPGGLGEIFKNLVLNVLINPIQAIINANYLSILIWSVIFGIALKRIASEKTKQMLMDFSNAVSLAVKWIIGLAPFGICGLVFGSVSKNGLGLFINYGKLVLLLAGCMLTMALIVNPIISALFLKCNPYPLVFRCLRESAFTAFFTRSSAANIPVNMQLCEDLGLDKDMYSVSIPLGATINMDGAAITITVMTLAAVNTVGVDIGIPAAFVMSVFAAIGACGASGVAGGSLLLIPMACSLFGISNDVAMQVVGVGFVIGVIQDSMETALNSSSDVLFTAVAEYSEWRREGKPLPKFLVERREK